jgi:hypothetical protein
MSDTDAVYLLLPLQTGSRPSTDLQLTQLPQTVSVTGKEGEQLRLGELTLIRHSRSPA